MILCSGAFDGLHAGHVAYLEEAAKRCGEGERVTVAVAPDSYIRQEKGREPYWSQTERAYVIARLWMVSAAIPQREATPAKLIRELRPRVFVKGRDWVDKLPTDVLDACREAGTRIVHVDTEGRHVRIARSR